MALHEVTFVGEPVVAILAKDRASTEDLIDEVDIDYEALPIVSTLEEAKQGKLWLTMDGRIIFLRQEDVRKGMLTAQFLRPSM